MTEPSHKSERAGEWLRYLVSRKAFVISAQVMTELAHVSIKKSHFFKQDDLKQALENLTPFCQAPLGPATLIEAYKLHLRYGSSWFDAVLLASALEAGCKYFLSEDLNHLQQIGSLRILNPFRLAPEDL